MKQQENETFAYTYSSKQQEEVRSIREKYIPKEEDKMAQLRKLDESATRPGTYIAITVGFISTLIFGVGLCCVMVWKDYFVIGIIIGMIGMIGIASAYPLFHKITKKQREKLAPEIIKLTDELMMK